MQLRYAAYAAPVLLVAVIAGALLLASDTGPQPTRAATSASEVAERSAEVASVLPAGSGRTDGRAQVPTTVVAAPIEPAATTDTATTLGPIPPTERALCESGAAVGTGNPGLLDDCAVLLAVKDPLRGTATLNWSADTAIADWDGITLGGDPQRVTRLRLDYEGLNGSLPRELGGLAKLQWLDLLGNDLTGMIPAELGSLGAVEILYLQDNGLTGPIPPELGTLPMLRWLALDGNELSGSIPVELTNLPALEDLELDNNELGGVIPAGLVDLHLRALYLDGNQWTGCIPAGLSSVRYGDIDSLSVDTCTTTTTYALTTSGTGSGGVSPLPGTYTYLDGESVTVTATPDQGNRVASWSGDCSGTGSTCALTMDADKTASVTFERITHSLTVTVTGDGTVTPGGTTTQNEGDEVTLTASWNDATHDFTGWGGDCSGATTTCVLTMDANKSVTATFAALPADRCATTTAADCIRAVYLGTPGDYAQVTDIPADKLVAPAADGRYYVGRGQQLTVVTAAPLPADWTRFYLQWSPLEFGTPSSVSSSQLIKPVGTTYTFTVSDDEAASTLITFDLRAARPFVRPRPDGKPELGDVVVTTVFSVETKTFRYDTFDTTGAVAMAGSYAFLSDPADTTTAVTTYEALRDGTTTSLLVHQSDAHGASQTALYDTVVAGDIFEWHEADDCFVRYGVKEVMPDPSGSVPRKLLAVEGLTYAFTGCTGTLSTGAVSSVAWGELPDLGGTSLAAPVVHGPFQIVPDGWSGTVIPGEVHDPPGGRVAYQSGGYDTTEVAVARGFPYWRDPTLPADWVFSSAYTGGILVSYGYCADYVNAAGYLALRICGEHATGRLWPDKASWLASGGSGEMRQGVNETRMIAGRPALVDYSPQGPNHFRRGGTVVRVYDAATQSVYEITGADRSLLGSNVAGVITIARSLFEGDNPQ